MTAPPADTRHEPAAAPTAAPVLRDVMREHLEESASLLVQRRTLLCDPEEPVSRLAAVDARLAAHWDGLCVGRPVSVAVALAVLDDAFDPWDTAVAGRAWLELGRPEPDAVAERLQAAAGETLGGWTEALRLVPAAVAGPVLAIATDLAPDEPLLAPLLDAAGWHGRLPAAWVAKAAASGEPRVRYALARALGWAAPDGTDAAAVLRSLGADPEATVRRAALWSEVLRDPAAGLARCGQLVQEGGHDAFTLVVVGLLGGEKEHAWLAARAAGAPEDEQAAALAAAALARLAALGIVIPPPAERAEEPASPPLARLWRASLVGRDRDLAWLRRAVPPGFFADEPDAGVEPGE